MNDLRRTKAYLFLILGMGVLLLIWQRMDREKLVVYCAHDSVFADGVLREFTKETGIEVTVKYDTEATKSLGLVEQIIADGAKPRCDVFWNNELLGTVDLAERGLLEPYQGEGWKRVPEKWRDDHGRWAGFAGRLRMRMWNTEKGRALEPMLEMVDGRPALNLPSAQDPLPVAPGNEYGAFAIAKPLYGTTLTHYTVLWRMWGPAGLQYWHTETRAHGLREASGNSEVKDFVAAGTCAAGYVDVDDFYEARDGGKPVAAEPVVLPDGATICIPNTVAIIHGTKRIEEAQRLADFLLSAKAEIALAKSASRQIPLGALSEAEKAQVPAEVRELVGPAGKGRELKDLLPARRECLEWLKKEYLK